MSEYSSASALARRLITKKGRSDVAVYRPGVGSPSDAQRPWRPDVSAPDELIASGLHAVFLDPGEVRGSLGQLGLNLAFRTRVVMPDSLVPDSTATALLIPEELGTDGLRAGDLLESDGHRYTVIRCSPFSPGGELVLYTVHLKE